MPKKIRAEVSENDREFVVVIDDRIAFHSADFSAATAFRLGGRNGQIYRMAVDRFSEVVAPEVSRKNIDR